MKNHGQPRWKRILNKQDRCACGNLATHYCGGPRCERCKKLEEGWACKHTTNGGIRERAQSGLEPYAVLLPSWGRCE